VELAGSKPRRKIYFIMEGNLLTVVRVAILKPHHVAKIRSVVPGFLQYLETKEGRESLKERADRKRLFGSYFGRESIEELTEEQLREALKILWANAMWSNKDYLVDKILEANPFPELKERLKELLWGERPLQERYDEFMESVKYLKTAQITEIMCFTRPDDYALWNRRVMDALSQLGFGDVLPVGKYYPSGAEYETIVQAFKEVADALREEKVPDADLTIGDLLYWYIDTHQTPRKETETAPTHEEILDILRAIGDSLGFDAQSEVSIAKGARVDVVWSARVGNLGVIKYVFEVQMKGNIDSLILNIQKALKHPQVQKAVVVSTPDQLEKIKEEIEEVSKDLARRVSYLDVAEVIKARELLTKLNQILSKLELVPASSPSQTPNP